MRYSLTQWLLFFFLYCFLGWIWECLYVSAYEKRWINRGFLYGPLTPIYGFGAVTVILITSPVQESIPMIFLVGMTSATVLEYGTGVVLQRLFQARYWDYTSNRLNLDGYICPFCSLGWGLFSVVLIKVLHPVIERAILKIPADAAGLISAILVTVCVADTSLSIRSVLHLQKN